MNVLNYKKIFLWTILSSFILSMFVVFVTPYISDAFKELSFRLLIGFCIFFGTLIIILLILLFRKKETQEMLRERALRSEYKNSIDKKIKNLKQKFNKALKIVKRASLYKFKSRYELPWYLVMGEEKEGKTSLIEYSGLDFPINYEDRFSEDDESFKWYFAEKSIFIDLPGNYIEQTKNPEDPIIWKYFLNFFLKRRWRRPINGIILTISVDSILNKNNNDLENFAKQLRDRFDELSRVFMSSVPIYLIVTKSDKLDGFSEYFNFINQDEKDEIFGITFENENFEKDNINQKFEELVKRLNSSVIDKMHFEWTEKNRGKIFLFTEKTSQLLSKITYFTNVCFSETRYRKPLMLRGIYFTTVEKNYASNEKPKALFIKKLLDDLVFQEAEISKIDENYKNKIKRVKVLSYIASISILVLVSFFMINSFTKVNDSLSNYENKITNLINSKKEISENSSYEDISKVLEQINVLALEESKLKNGSFFNKYIFKFEDNSEEIKKIYINELLTLLLNKNVKQIEKNIVSDLADFSKTWDNTKAYLMLELIEKRDKVFLQNYMKKNWEKEIDNIETQQKLVENWKNLLELGFSSYKINHSLVETSRTRLVELSAEQLTYEDWKSKFNYLNAKSFSFSDILGENISLFSGSEYKIHGLYTKNGYEVVLKEGKIILDEILLNNWVIGKKANLTSQEKDEFYEKIMQFYFSDYRKYWYEALSNLSVVSYNELAELNQQLAILTSPQSPVISILKSLKINTNLYSPTEQIATLIPIENNLVDSISKKISIEKIEELDIVDVKSVKTLREFYRPYHDLLDDNYQPKGTLTSLFNEFNKTYEIMSNINGSVNSEEDAFKIVSSRVHGKLAPMIAQLNLMPIQVKKWYEYIIQGNLGFIAKGAKNYIEGKYRKDVLAFYNERLRGKYPLKKDAQTNVKLDDFNEFFRKDGVLDTFYKQYVSGFIEIDYQKSVAKSRTIDGNRLNFSKSFIASLIKAEQIRKALFKNDGTLGTTLNIKANTLGTNLATVELDYDSNTILYEHGPILTKKIFWPNTSSDSSIKFKLYDLSNKIVVEDYIDNDDWSLFKFIDKNTLSKGENGSLNISYEKYDFKSSFLIGGSIAPLFLDNNGLNFELSKGL